MENLAQKLARCLAVLAAGAAPGTASAEPPEAAPEVVLTSFMEGEDLPDEERPQPLERGSSSEVAEAFEIAFHDLLAHAPPLERTYLVSSGALSPHREIRLAIARALNSSWEANGARTAVRHLLADPSPDVRGAADRAAQRRGVRRTG